MGSRSGMRRLAALAAVIGGTFTCLAAQPAAAVVEPPVGMADTDAAFRSTEMPARGLYNIDNWVRVFTSESAGAGWFWSQEFKFVDGDGGYMGIQTNGTLNDGSKHSRVAIFSIFDNGPPGIEHGVRAEHSNCKFEPFENAVKCAIAYPWKIGSAYKLRIWELCCADQPNARETWGAWIITEGGAETFIGSISVPGGWDWLTRYANSFVEFHSTVVDRCADIPYTRARWQFPRGNNGSIVATGALRGSNEAGGLPAGYRLGQCVGWARAYNTSVHDYMETGLGNSNADAVDLTIDHYYHSGLGREPDAAGRAHFISFAGDGTGTACRDGLKRAARDIHGSPEFATKWTTARTRVNRLYLSILHRRPDPGGSDDWVARFNALGGDWLALVNEFVNSPEVLNRLGAMCTFRYHGGALPPTT